MHFKTIFLLILMLAFGTITTAFAQDEVIIKVWPMTSSDDATVAADSYFENADQNVLTLGRKIAQKTPITLEEVKALPEGALNARYDGEITLLFFALLHYNLQAIDVLLAAGADPYMVDYPSQKSVRDFTYYMSDITVPDSIDATKQFRTDLVRIYLKNGGDPNHRLSSRSKTPLLVGTVLMRDYKGARLLIDAGGDPLVMDETGLSPVTMLASRYGKEEQYLFTYIVCRGYYEQATLEQVEKIMLYLTPTGPKNPERAMRYRQIAMYILKRHPDYKNDYASGVIFGGPTPWQEILHSDDKDLCPIAQ